MKELEALLEEALHALSEAQDPEGVEAVRVRFLGRNGSLTARFADLRDRSLSREEKAELGKNLNAVKGKLEEALAQRGRELSSAAPARRAVGDLTLPGYRPPAGRLHPVSQTIAQIVEIFQRLGFAVVEGPEVETEWYNFEALNIPADHPSRESFDTFYLRKIDSSRWLLRSHTSPVQVRFMERHPPPFRIVVPGRVFRPDAVDASHCFQFHQVEGLAVGAGLSFGDLKGTLTAWARQMFGPGVRLRFRPHYFPFTEPSAEVDLGCIFCQGKGCRVCGQKGWLEILGCGMVHPEVFKAVAGAGGSATTRPGAVGYLPETVGFAFGMGVERIAMLLHGIDDIRLFFENDLRFLRQFR